jgi:ferredoxin
MTETTGTYTVTLQPAGWRFTANADEALLAAAARADIRLPSSCRNGTCRTCMCQLIDGEVIYPGGRPGLTAEEMEERWILPCVGQARTDLRIDAPDAAPLDKTPPPPIMTGPRR